MGKREEKVTYESCLVRLQRYNADVYLCAGPAAFPPKRNVLRPGGQMNYGLGGAISLYRLNRDSRQLVRCACLYLKVGDMTPTLRDQKFKNEKGVFLIACSQNMEKSGLWKIVSSEL